MLQRWIDENRFDDLPSSCDFSTQHGHTVRKQRLFPVNRICGRRANQQTNERGPNEETEITHHTSSVRPAWQRSLQGKDRSFGEHHDCNILKVNRHVSHARQTFALGTRVLDYDLTTALITGSHTDIEKLQGQPMDQAH